MGQMHGRARVRLSQEKENTQYTQTLKQSPEVFAAAHHRMRTRSFYRRDGTRPITQSINQSHNP